MKLYLNMKKHLLLLVVVLLLNPFYAQKDLTIKQKLVIEKNIVDGLYLLRGGDSYGAINLYKEVLSLSPNHPKALFRLTESYLQAKDYKQALKYLEEVKGMEEEVKSSDFHAILGLVYFETEQLDSALYHFNAVKDNKDLQNRYLLDSLIAQVSRAQKMLAQPYEVTFKRLSRSINSAFMDYGVKLSPDGNQMYFTSRRPSTSGSLKNDCPGGDYNYYSDIYISQKDPSTGNWGLAELAPGKVNDKYFDDFLCLNAAGDEMLIYRNDGCKLKVTGDIYISKSKGGKWGTAKPLTDPKDKTINTPIIFESGAVLSPDGNTIYFISDRKDKDAQGSSDIYMSKKTGASWSTPKNLGPNVNTPLREAAISLSPDGNTMYFSSQGHNSMGGYDVFMSKYENGSWGKAINLGAPINSVRNDLHFYVAPDGTGYINTIQMTTYGSYDIYQLDLSKHPMFK